MMEYPEIINDFSPISLEEINSIKDSVRLMDRHDTKFVFAVSSLEQLLRALIPTYKIMEIGNSRVFKYENLYFDTEDVIFYRQHHNKKLNRYKFRFRKYVESDIYFWEIKFKSNKKKTIKDRFKHTSIDKYLTRDIKEKTTKKIQRGVFIDLDLLAPSLWSTFYRITLANLDLRERITIDTEVNYRNPQGKQKKLEGLSIAELKQERFSLRSPFAIAAKELKIYPGPFSKYCTGIALLEDNVRINGFKRRLLNLEKLTGGKLQCLRNN